MVSAAPSRVRNSSFSSSSSSSAGSTWEEMKKRGRGQAQREILLQLLQLLLCDTMHVGGKWEEADAEWAGQGGRSEIKPACIQTPGWKIGVSSLEYSESGMDPCENSKIQCKMRSNTIIDGVSPRRGCGRTQMVSRWPTGPPIRVLPYLASPAPPCRLNSLHRRRRHLCGSRQLLAAARSPSEAHP